MRYFETYKSASSFMLLIALAVLFISAGASAIEIDRFLQNDTVNASGVGGTSSKIYSAASIIGGKRSVEVESLAAATTSLNISSGVVSHSQDAANRGISTIVWDGDSVVGASDYTGLGGVDFTADGAENFLLDVVFDYAFSSSIEIVISVYDAGDASGATKSSYSLVLNVAISPAQRFVIPFSGFSGSADLTNVGLLKLEIKGLGIAADLTLSDFVTDGKCENLIPVNGNVVDDCGKCGGNNEDKDECGVCFGRNKDKDECEVCFGENKDKDECGVCFGRNRDKDECEVCFGRNEDMDDCGVCFGEDKDIDDCGICFGKNGSKDECGICAGDGSSCTDCAGEAYGSHVLDKEEQCCLPEEIDECGICHGPGRDACGVCDGDGSSCADCKGIPNGKNVRDLSGQCCLPEEIDECGVCLGDSSSCECVEQQATGKERRKVKRVLKKAAILEARVDQFGKATEECNGDYPAKDVRKASRILKKMKVLMENAFLQTWSICSNSVCTTSKSNAIIRKLKKRTHTLYSLAKKSKLTAIQKCNFQHDSNNDHRKVTEDYRDDVLKTIRRLPKEKFFCN